MEDDLREGITALLQVCKKFQVNALTMNHALAKIGKLSREDRAALTQSKIEDLIAEHRGEANRIADAAAAALEQALAKDRHVVVWLKAYPSYTS